MRSRPDGAHTWKALRFSYAKPSNASSGRHYHTRDDPAVPSLLALSAEFEALPVESARRETEAIMTPAGRLSQTERTEDPANSSGPVLFAAPRSAAAERADRHD